jgi:exosortase K
MIVPKSEIPARSRPWISWTAALAAAYFLKRFYSRSSAGDLGWILAPTARAVGWLRGETLFLDPGAGWVAPDGSYVIAPACAGVNFLIVALAVSVLGFSHRLGSPGRRLVWWLGSLLGAWALTIAVNTARILAAVELYRLGPVAGLTPEAAHRLLGIVIYLGALWGLFTGLDRLTGGRSGAGAAMLVSGLYLGMTVVTPFLNGAFRQPGYAGHAMMVSLVTLIWTGTLVLGFRRREKT